MRAAPTRARCEFVTNLPDWSVCELATMGASYEPDVGMPLRHVPGVVDETRVRDELMRQLARPLVEDRTLADRA